VEDIVLPEEALAARASSSGLQVTGHSGSASQPLIENDEYDLYKEYLEIHPITNTGKLV